MTSNQIKINLLGVDIHKVTMNEATQIVSGMLENSKQHYVVTPNSEFMVYAQKDDDFKQILNRADLAIPDGIGIIWASKLLNRGLPSLRGDPCRVILERVTGTDLMLNLCQEAEKQGWSIYLLGGQGNIAENTASLLTQKYPDIIINGYSNQDPDLPVSDYDLPPTDLLFVAYGHPKQERWIAQNLPHLPVKVAMGVGGAFDFITGKQKRAPKLFQKLGLEWSWRLMTQPWRIKRQRSLVTFVWLVLKQRLSKKGRPV